MAIWADCKGLLIEMRVDSVNAGTSILRRVLLTMSVLLPLLCSESLDGTSEDAQTQLYQVVLFTALEHSQVSQAVPQIQLQTVRVAPDGVAYPGNKSEHYDPESSPALIRAAEEWAYITLRAGVADFHTRFPAEIFVFSNPTFSGNSAATVGVRVTRLTTAAYSSDAWEARLRWRNGQWVLREWVYVKLGSCRPTLVLRISEGPCSALAIARDPSPGRRCGRNEESRTRQRNELSFAPAAGKTLRETGLEGKTVPIWAGRRELMGGASDAI